MKYAGLVIDESVWDENSAVDVFCCNLKRTDGVVNFARLTKGDYCVKFTKGMVFDE